MLSYLLAALVAGVVGVAGCTKVAQGTTSTLVLEIALAQFPDSVNVRLQLATHMSADGGLSASNS